MELSFVKLSQDDTQPKVFAMDATWVAAWQEYHRGINSSNRVHPGPINNRRLSRSLIALTGRADSVDCYFISKMTFYFFHSLYGGGPAVVDNFYFSTQNTIQPILNAQPASNSDE
jgi:hypothetical protein